MTTMLWAYLAVVLVSCLRDILLPRTRRSGDAARAQAASGL